MLPTPSTSHINVDRVYEPAEDSFLLLDTFSSSAEIAFLQHRFSRQEAQTSSPLVLEVGTGSGVVVAFVTAYAREIFGRNDVLTLGADVNDFACAATVETAHRACNEDLTKARSLPSTGLFLSCVRADLGSTLRPHSIDVLIFNPPYVPSAELPNLSIGQSDEQSKDGGYEISVESHFERDSHLLSLSYAGGADGMEVTNRLLDQLPELLSLDTGMAYILLCKQNKPEEVMGRIRTWSSSWAVEVVGQSGKVGGWEKLQILRIWRV